MGWKSQIWYADATQEDDLIGIDFERHAKVASQTFGSP
jgi:hypothetical protein